MRAYFSRLQDCVFLKRYRCPAKDKKGRGAVGAAHKSLVIGAVEVIQYVDKKGKAREKAGRIRLQVIKNADEKTIEDFLKQGLVPSLVGIG